MLARYTVMHLVNPNKAGPHMSMFQQYIVRGWVRVRVRVRVWVTKKDLKRSKALLNLDGKRGHHSSGKLKSLTNRALSYFLVYMMTSHNALMQLHLP